MKIDFISDIHENHYLGRTIISDLDDFIEYIWGPSHKDGKILFLLGDIGEQVDRIVSVLKKIKEKRNYEKIFYVPGNHDLYWEGEFDTFEKKYEAIKIAIEPLEDIFCLDGEIHEVDGLKISGATLWYDISYLKDKKQLSEEEAKKEFMNLWNFYMLDSRRTNSDPLKFFNEQVKRIENVYDKVDIFLSHINPINLDAYFDKRYRNEDSNTFFSFNGKPFIRNGSIKYWFYGHTHNRFRGEFVKTKLFCNPLGYPNENPYREGFVEQVEV